MIRLSRLDLLRWGSFTNRTLSFGEGDARLHVVYGGNAAGKSTTRRGASALLFGIPACTPDAHTHDYGDLRIGALLLTDHGSVEVIRRKGNVNTLLDADGQPLADDPIAIGLHGLTADAFAGLFEISHESLVDGGRDLLAGHGAVGESLFAAAAGTGRLHRLLTALDAEAADLFKPSGRKAPLNVALAEYSNATKQLSGATIRPTRAVELRRKVATTDSRIAELDAELRDLQKSYGRLCRLKAVKPILARHGELTSELESLDDPPPLDGDVTDLRRTVHRDRDEADRDIRAATKSLASFREKREQRDDPEGLLASEAAIKATHSQIAAIRKAAIDRRRREDDLRREEERLIDLVGGIRVGMRSDELDEHTVDERTRRGLEQSLESRGEINERFRGATERVTSAKRALKEAQERLDRHPEVPDTASLRAAIRAAAQLGPLESQVAERKTRVLGLHSDAEKRFARLDPKPVTIEDLDRQAVPAQSTVERFAAAAHGIEESQSAIERETGRLDREANEVAARRAGIQAGGHAPTGRDLELARGRRANDWHAVREALATPTADAEDRAQCFEQSMQSADQIADIRVARADLLAQLAELDSVDARLAAEREGVGARASELRRRRSALEDEWHSAWSSSQMPAPAVAHAAAWLTERDHICALLNDAEIAARRARADEQTVARHLGTLMARMLDLAVVASPDATLAELVAFAEFTADDCDAGAARRESARDDVDRLVRALDRERRALGEAEEAVKAWRQEWEVLRDRYGLEPHIAPDETADMLRRIDEALGTRRRALELRRRIAGIDRDHEEFAGEVTRLCVAVAPDLSDSDPERVAASLMDRVTDAQRSREATDAIDSQIVTQEASLGDAQRRRDTAQEQLDAMIVMAGATHESELADIERRSSRAAALRREIPGCEREIAQAGEDSFEALASASAKSASDALEADIAELDLKIAALREERDTAQQAAFEAREAFSRAEHSDGAGQAAELAQQHLAGAHALARRYAVAKLSAYLLRDTIERYRRKHQGPMLRRANELFPLLTRDTFTELYVDWNDAGDPVLVGRDDQGRRLRVEQMSAGTREQLFLALRIAAIERYVGSSGAVPVLFDDVFLESDEPRSERIFAALADLAAHTQVIVFTHHRHLLAIAQQVVDPERLALHSLDGEPLGVSASATATTTRRAAA